MKWKYFKRTVLLLFLLSFFPFYERAAYAHEPIFSIGPETIFKGGVGIEVATEYFEKTKLLEDGNEIADPLDREKRGLKVITEIIYGLTEDLALTIEIPYLSLETEETSGGQRIKKSSSGIGDIVLRSKYSLFERDMPGASLGVSSILGIKLPTGDEDKDPVLGTGSVDVFGGVASGYESRRWYAFGDLRYRLNTEANNIRKGNVLNYNVVFGIRPWLTEYEQPDLVLLVEFNGEYAWKDKGSGVTNPNNTGGNTISISPGILLSYRNVMLKAGVKLPISQELNGTQLGEDYEVVTAIEIHF